MIRGDESWVVFFWVCSRGFVSRALRIARRDLTLKIGGFVGVGIGVSVSELSNSNLTSSFFAGWNGSGKVCYRQ